MNSEFPMLKSDTEGHLRITVEAKDTAASYGSGLIEVFATPAMIGLMEATSQQSVQPLLPEGYITLGTEVHVKHFKATPLGCTVDCKSKLIEVDGRKLTFEVSASDEEGPIGSGTHTRFIVNSSKFMEKLRGNRP